MSCKLGSRLDTAAARPVSWRRLDLTAPPPGQAPPDTVPASALDQAREEVRVLRERLADLEHSLDPMKREAWDKGFRAGQGETQQAAQREIDAERQRGADAIAYMIQLRAWWRRELESGAVTLAMAVARRVLNRELSIDPNAIQAIVRVALEKAQGQELRRVRVAPAHAASVRSCLAVEAPGVELVPDVALQPGDVRFEMGQGAIDASVDAQLEEITRGFADAAER